MSPRRIEREHLHLQWLVAHRELQLQRAYATGSRGYIALRARKLDQARNLLAAIETRRAAA